MLSAILDWSLRHRVVVLVLWLGIAASGLLAARALPLDAFPDVTPVQVVVDTPARALTPVEVERRVTSRVELALGGLPGLIEVRSISKAGLSQVTATFTDGDLHRARTLVSERLAQVQLDAGLGPPALGPASTGLGEVFHYLVTGPVSLLELRRIQDLVIRPRLATVPGVAEINAWGGDPARVEIRVDPVRLHRHQLDLATFVEALQRQNVNVSGGPIEVGGEGTLVQAVAQADTVAEIEALVVATRDHAAVTVGQVAEVAVGRELRRGAVTADGAGEVVLGLGFAGVGENGRAVTERLQLRLAEIARTLPHGVRAEPVYERTWLVDRVLDTVSHSLVLGAVLVVSVLFLFLGSLRAGLVVAAVIPLSMLFATELMLWAGVAGSLMSLGAIDFGLLVDSAVIQVENVVATTAGGPTLDGRSSGGGPPSDGRSSGGGPPSDRLARVRDAILEVRGPTALGELLIAVVFLPVLTLEGVEGKLFRPMALTMLFALLGSFLLSLTLIPALASFVAASHPPTTSPLSAIARLRGRVADALTRGYRRLLRGLLRAPWVVIALTLATLGGAGWLATGLGAEFVPRLREGSLVINTVRLAGISLDESVRYGQRIEAYLLGLYPNVIDRIWTRTGAGEVATDPMGVEVSDVFVMLAPRGCWVAPAEDLATDRCRRSDATRPGPPRVFSSEDALVADLTRHLGELPGMRAAVSQPIELRVNEMGAGIRSDLGVVLYGDDFDRMRELARRIQQVVESVPGATGVRTEPLTGQPMLEVVFDPQALGRHGLEMKDALSAVEVLAGIDVGVVPEGERRTALTVVLDPRYRGSAEAVGQIPITGRDGQRIPLGDLARVTRVESPASIQREGGRRRVIVEADVRGRDLASFVAEVRAAVTRDVALPDGWFIRYGGQFEHLERARERLLIVIPVSLALVLLLLAFTYRRARDVLRVFLGVPFAAVGGVLALTLAGLPFSISAAVGFIALIGIAVLGDIVLVSTIRSALASGLPVLTAIEDAAARRLRPVIMTALVAGLGFLPMALATGPGAEVQRPLATVVIGGVLSSTVLTLLVLPVLYRWTSPSRPKATP